MIVFIMVITILIIIIIIIIIIITMFVFFIGRVEGSFGFRDLLRVREFGTLGFPDLGFRFGIYRGMGV